MANYSSKVALAIVGSRNYNEYDNFCVHLNHWIKTHPGFKINSIVSGGAKGVDSLAHKYAEAHNIPITIHYANWVKYSRSAGPMRNQLIVNDATHLIAFPDKRSVGTWDSVNKAKKKKIAVTIFHI